MGWRDTDDRCLACGRTIKEARGINKQNLKRLVWSKPTWREWVDLFIIIMILLIAWRYNVETTECQAVIQNLDQICVELNMAQRDAQEFRNRIDYGFNIPNFNINENET